MQSGFLEAVKMLLKDVLSHHTLMLLLVSETSWASLRFVWVESCPKRWCEMRLFWCQAEAR